jgi:spermidine/putrescine ABC transporter ATP-binding subunit
VADQPKTVLHFDRVTKSYGGVDAVRDIDLKIHEGEFFTLLGPSGSGKSTLLLLIAGFQQPTRGEIYLDGRALSGVPPHRRQLGVVFQNYALFPHMTIFENIAFSLRNLKWRQAEIRNRVTELLDLVHLENMADRLPGQLSGGQQQRVALARALAFRPSVLLLDEPLSALDKKLRAEMLLEFQRLHKTLQTTMVFVTHDQEEALAMSDRIAVLDRGRIARLGAPRDLYEDPGEPLVAEFLGETNFFTGVVNDAGYVEVDGMTWFLPSRGSRDAGTQVRLAVRPEKICIGVPEDQCISATGEIAEVLYLGPITSYKVRLSSGRILTVKQFNRLNSVDLTPGTSITVWWHPGDCRALTSMEGHHA